MSPPWQLARQRSDGRQRCISPPRTTTPCDSQSTRTTYAARLVAVLFGPLCPHFQEVFTIAQEVALPATKKCKRRFTEEFCKQLKWAIIHTTAGTF